MAQSLNCVDKAIHYDNRIDFYIDKFGFDAELVFSFRFPVLLSHINECYCIEVKPDSFECAVLKSTRRMVVAGTRNWISHTGADFTHEIKFGKTDFYTSIVAALEVKNEEIDSVIEFFSKDDQERMEKFHNETLQNVIENILFRYNEKANGDSFLTPSILDCSEVELCFYINYLNKKLLRCRYERFHMDLINQDESPITDSEFAEEVKNWRYFYNKCKYDLARNDYVDCIISAAISVESYMWHIIRKNCSNDAMIKSVVEDQDGNHLSATKLYKRLNNNGWINGNLSNNMLSSTVEKILLPRNKIMHGEQSINNPHRMQAENSYKQLKNLYSLLGEKVEDSSIFDDVDHNPDYIQYRDYVIRCQNDDFESAKELMEVSSQMIDKLPGFEYPRTQYIKALFLLGEINKAREELESVFEQFSNQSVVAVELFSSINEKMDINDAISLYEGITNKDVRVYAVLAYLYLRKLCNDKSNPEIVSCIIDCLKMTKQIDSKYLLPVYIEWHLYREINNPNEIVLMETIANCVELDYSMPLLLSEKLVQCDLPKAIKYYDLFLDRFEKYHYKGLKVDFMTFITDLDHIKTTSDYILKYANDAGLKTNHDNNEIDGILTKGIEGYMSTETLNLYQKGEMPLGNLFYRNILMIPEGSMIYC